MRAGTLIGGCVAVLIALAVAAFLATHDRVDGQEWVGPSGEARLRPFLAAERFAERMGLKVSELRALRSEVEGLKRAIEARDEDDA